MSLIQGESGVAQTDETLVVKSVLCIPTYEKHSWQRGKKDINVSHFKAEHGTWKVYLYN